MTLRVAKGYSWGRPPTPMKHILIAEDDPLIRELVHELVCFFGHEAQATRDGADLLHTLENQVPDLVIMDVRMPAIDGLQAIRRIREDSRLRHLPVIALTASAMRGYREACLQSGFDAYLTKPINSDELRREIERLLGA